MMAGQGILETAECSVSQCMYVMLSSGDWCLRRSIIEGWRRSLVRGDQRCSCQSKSSHSLNE